MKPLKPHDLIQSPLKPVNHTPQKVDPGKPVVSNVSVNLIDAMRLMFRKAIENKVVDLLKENSGITKIAGASIGGFGMFAWVNWPLLLTGNVVEILKLIVCVAVTLFGWFVKK